MENGKTETEFVENFLDISLEEHDTDLWNMNSVEDHNM